MGTALGAFIGTASEPGCDALVGSGCAGEVADSAAVKGGGPGSEPFAKGGVPVSKLGLVKGPGPESGDPIDALAKDPGILAKAFTGLPFANAPKPGRGPGGDNGPGGGSANALIPGRGPGGDSGPGGGSIAAELSGRPALLVGASIAGLEAFVGSSKRPGAVCIPGNGCIAGCIRGPGCDVGGSFGGGASGAINDCAAFANFSGMRSGTFPAFIESNRACTPALSPFLVNLSSFRSFLALNIMEMLLLNGPRSNFQRVPSGGHLLMTGLVKDFDRSSSSGSGAAFAFRVNCRPSPVQKHHSFSFGVGNRLALKLESVRC
mmetsp:Transcript_18303/g.32744  ORF Transcript_18303/g.32744 Transcript_18303/m.32744 type:complete len:319 (+) Transcript_18303:1451-2407(+)